VLVPIRDLRGTPPCQGREDSVSSDVIVPLFEPRDEFGNAGQQRRQTLYDAAFSYKCISEPFGFYLRKVPMPGVRLYPLARSGPF
jgi:hypothetical protein